MKALIVTRVSGFVPQFEMNHVRILQQMGYEVHYAANFDVVVYGEDNSRLEGTGIVCHHIAFCRSPFSPEVLSSYRQLKQLILTEQFDLIHCHMPMTGVITRMAAQAVRRRTKRKTPVIYTAHGFHFYSGAPIKNWIYYLPERWLARYTDCLITMNEEDYERARTFPVRGSAWKIPGVGIELGEDKETDEDRAEIRHRVRAELGISETDFVMVSVGELTVRKNHIQILRMLCECSDKAIKYVLCGSGPLWDELKAFVAEHQLENRVVFTGYCQNVGDMLAASDCFVFPSFQEGLPMAVMEAMRAGLPVIANQIRGNVDLIENGKGGMLLKNGTAAEYLEAVVRLKSTPGHAREMGEWNRKRIRNFSVSQVIQKMTKIYESLSGERFD